MQRKRLSHKRYGKKPSCPALPAIFSALKGLPKKEVLEHLKKSLRGHFKQALREVKGKYAPRLRELERYCCN